MIIWNYFIVVINFYRAVGFSLSFRFFFFMLLAEYFSIFQSKLLKRLATNEDFFEKKVYFFWILSLHMCHSVQCFTLLVRSNFLHVQANKLDKIFACSSRQVVNVRTGSFWQSVNINHRTINPYETYCI